MLRLIAAIKAAARHTALWWPNPNELLMLDCRCAVLLMHNILSYVPLSFGLHSKPDSSNQSTHDNNAVFVKFVTRLSLHRRRQLCTTLMYSPCARLLMCCCPCKNDDYAALETVANYAIRAPITSQGVRKSRLLLLMPLAPTLSSKAAVKAAAGCNYVVVHKLDETNAALNAQFNATSSSTCQSTAAR